jgi:hypothetical protein
MSRKHTPAMVETLTMNDSRFERSEGRLTKSVTDVVYGYSPNTRRSRPTHTFVSGSSQAKQYTRASAKRGGKAAPQKS